MSGFQKYLFRNVLRTLLAIVGGLVFIALLTQGLSQIDLIVEDRQSTLTYLWVSLLAAPQIISLLLPIALFIAVVGALNVAHRENEVVVAQSTGMSHWQVASPVLRLAVMASLLHLVLNLWIQPVAFREMRSTVVEASSNFMATMVRPGVFTSTPSGLTTYAREVQGPEMRDLFVNDARNPEETTTYIAKTGILVQLDGLPAIVMRDGYAQQSSPGANPETLAFEQSTFDLAPFSGEQEAVIFKESDRYLPELFFPDLTNYFDHANRDRFFAEGHARIAAPLLNIAMAMIAIYAVLGGDFSRRGYGQRIAWAAAGAIFLRLAAFGAASAGESDRWLNVLQYLLPMIVFGVLAWLHFAKPQPKQSRRGQERRPSLGPALATGG